MVLVTRMRADSSVGGRKMLHAPSLRDGGSRIERPAPCERLRGKIPMPCGYFANQNSPVWGFALLAEPLSFVVWWSLFIASSGKPLSIVEIEAASFFALQLTSEHCCEVAAFWEVRTESYRDYDTLF